MITQYNFLATWLKAQAKSERGASLVEYALLVALIAVVCITAVTMLGSSASDKFSEISSAVDN
ncbi:MAG: Flp family type IVb pilin [Acidimicrobiales bacterium]